MAKRRIGGFDLDTGEIIEGVPVVFAARRKVSFPEQGGFFFMSQHATQLLAEADLGKQDYRVFLGLLTQLDFQNLIAVNQSELAAMLGMQRSHVSRSIKKLRELNVLLAGPKIGVVRSFRLNPNYGWRGSAKSHREALSEMLEERGMSVIEGGRENTPR